MFSLQQFFGKGDKFRELLEAAACEAHESVRLTVEIMKSPHDSKKMDDLVLSRRKEKKIFEQVSAGLVQTFVTGLEREDIEALSRGLYKIPKSTEKLAERFLIAGAHLDGLDFSRQADMMLKAADGVLAMIQQLRQMEDLQKIKAINDKLQYVEGEADKYMNELLRELYSGKFSALQAIVIRDLYELIEKIIDRCRDVGNVVMDVVLKNS
ncbi:MAG TPA: pit accessory protein [Verrucomicrobiae bacterium]